MNVMVDMAASPERMGTKDQLRFTPNGTRVPDGRPPKNDDDDVSMMMMCQCHRCLHPSCSS
jgi:hypothetical protein